MEIRLTINSKSIDVLMLNMFNSHGNDFASGCFVYLVCCSATHLTPFNFVQMNTVNMLTLVTLKCISP